ncbi:TerB family tellurite resistance protein [Pyxidicoccus sp. 3LG]
MLGLMAGLLIGNPWAIILLAIAGGIVGHRFDEQNAQYLGDPEIFADFLPPPVPSAFPEGQPDGSGLAVEEEPAPYEELVSDICAVFIEVARADGDVRREEVREVRRYFEKALGYGPESLYTVRSHLKAFLARPPALGPALDTCQAQMPSDERCRLLESLYALALADGNLQRSEREVLGRVARGLDIPAEEEEEIISDHLGDGTEHYEALGLTPEASDAEVKSAFRRLAAEHHPDKAAHLGRQAAEQASRRFQEVRDAYEEIRRLRGL